jgi:hypothetical protein
MIRQGLATDPHAFIFMWATPAFTADKPIMITLFSRQSIRVTGVQKINYSAP